MKMSSPDHDQDQVENPNQVQIGGAKRQQKIKNKMNKINKKETLNSFEFFSQGSYGCVSYPRIRCNNGRKDKRNKTKISKISLNNFYTENEYRIGNLLKNIKKRTTSKEEKEILNHFNYVDSRCDVQKSKLRIDESKHECKVLEKGSHKSSIVLMQSKYIESKEISEVLNDHFNIKTIIRFYYFMLNSMKVLHSHNIIHHDMHLGNVLVDTSDDFHLIDFGIAIHVSSFYRTSSKRELNHKYMKSILLSYDPQWKFWSLEYHILTFLVFKERIPNTKDIVNIVDSYFRNETAHLFETYFGNIQKYKEKCISFLVSKYTSSNKTIDEYCEEIITRSSHTWDIYQVNFILLMILKNSDLQETDGLIDLLKTGLHYDYMRRYNSVYYLTELIELIKNHKSLDINMFQANKTRQMKLDKEDILLLSKTPKIMI